MNRLKAIIKILCGTIIALWLLAFVLPKIPAVQSYLGKEVSTALEQKLGTKVKIERVDLRLFNRITIDGVEILDQQGKEMLRAGRISAGIELLPLLDGQIRITSAQLFGMQARLYQQDAGSPLNFQFVIDSLKSKDTLHHTPLDLRISSLIIRHGAVSYDRYDVPVQRAVFSPYHIDVKDLSAHIILNKLTDDSLDVNVKRLSLKEKSGLDIKQLSFSALASNNDIRIKNLLVRLPNSEITSPGSSFNYSSKGAKLASFNDDINLSARLTPSDFSFLYGKLRDSNVPLALNVSTKGTDKSSNATVKVTSPTLSADARATIYDILDTPHGELNISKLYASESFLKELSNYGLDLPDGINRLGDINANAKAHILSTKHIAGKADVATSKAGSLSVTGDINDKNLTARLSANRLNLQALTGEQSLGALSANLDVKTLDVNNLKQNTYIKGLINELTYNNYTYHNFHVDGGIRSGLLSGILNVNDANGELYAQGTADIAKKKIINADVDLRHFSPKQLHLTDIFGDTPLDAHLSVTPTSASLTSTIADISLDGDINIATIPLCINHIIASRLPSVPGLKVTKGSTDSFRINTRIKDFTFLKSITDLPITFNDDVTINGYLSAVDNTADLWCYIPSAVAGDMKFDNTSLHFFTPDQTLQTQLQTTYMEESGPVSLNLNLIGQDNYLTSTFSWDNLREKVFRGEVTANTRFYNTSKGATAFRQTIPQSHFEVGDSLWTVQSREILYEDGRIHVDNLNVGSASQNICLDGTLSRNEGDSLIATLHNVNIRYILDLVNFHSVDFDGSASGRFSAKSVLGDIKAGGHLDVEHFLFEEGNLGTLSLDASYSKDDNKIMLSGLCDDPEADAQTIVEGYVSPSPGEIDLNIEALNSRLEFVGTFCSSFMSDTDLHGSGKVQLYGPFSDINLRGYLKANGAFTLSSTNCRYTLPGDTVTFIPDDIQFRDFMLYDKSGNKATLTGGVHHKHLTQMSYDLYATTTRLLAYDFPTLHDEETFCGHAVINGDIGIHGSGNDLLISADAIPLEGTYLTYNASSPDALRTGDIITWRSANRDSQETDVLHLSGTDSDATIDKVLDAGNDRTNIRLDFLIHATPQSRLNLIMDEATGDYVDLFGGGDLHVKYYNKGSLDIFGNYTVNHGKYKMTIQNLIRRDFNFQNGSTITFGGDPYDAALNIRAVYPLNSVPLADLNIGSAFTAGNVPVNCLMNITGTPGQPSVAFDLDLPSLSTDARQMISSIINSEEEMNQQVLYLLAIGRFYAPSNANADSRTGETRSVSQGTLAMQSFLSGTLSQQFNNVMSNVMQNVLGMGSNLSFGANIAPGDEGFSNAEYEGLLSGHLFNNRLIFNGQFGYRDNINTNSQSFIGDFSLQYLLTKNGNISLKVYNQSNDRYFTRNSLNTQGIGVVFQKEFGK